MTKPVPPTPPPRRAKAPSPPTPRADLATQEASPRVARRERRRDRSREEIIDAVRRVLFRDGLAATTLLAVAREVGLTKAALYYYYPSKDAMLFEAIFGALDAQARAIHDAVEHAPDGRAAVRALIRETFGHFAGRLDDFRLAFLHGQVAVPGSVRVAPEQFERVRPLNDLVYGGTAEKLTAQWKKKRGRADVDPRLMAFLANASAIGLLTYKGMVESVGDPLKYSDEELVEGLARIFEAAAAP